MKKVFQLWGLQNEKGFDEQHVLSVVDRMLDARPEYIVTGQSNDHKMLQKICIKHHNALQNTHKNGILTGIFGGKCCGQFFDTGLDLLLGQQNVTDILLHGDTSFSF